MHVVRPAWMQFRLAPPVADAGRSRSAMRRLFVSVLLALPMLVAVSRARAADDPNLLHLPVDEFLGAFVFLVAIAVGFMLLLARLVRTTWRRADLEGLSPVAIGYLIGKVPRAFDALFLDLASYGVAKYSCNTGINITQGDRELPSDLEAFRCALPPRAERDTMIGHLKASRPAFEMLADLRRQGLLLSRARHWLLFIVVPLPAILVVGLGIEKIIFDWKQNQSVQILAWTCVATAVGLLVFWLLLANAHVTCATKRALKRLRKRLDAVIKAPPKEQIALAVALAGATVLAETAYRHYADVMDPPSSSSDDGYDDD